MTLYFLMHMLSQQVLPRNEKSPLRHLPRDVGGISTAGLFIGMLFSSFSWHVEDQNLYSISYQHEGASKTWYGVPASAADAFEDYASNHIYG